MSKTFIFHFQNFKLSHLLQVLHSRYRQWRQLALASLCLQGLVAALLHVLTSLTQEKILVVSEIIFKKFFRTFVNIMTTFNF